MTHFGSATGQRAPQCQGAVSCHLQQAAERSKGLGCLPQLTLHFDVARTNAQCYAAQAKQQGAAYDQGCQVEDRG